jgi:hypothetical protein
MKVLLLLGVVAILLAFVGRLAGPPKPAVHAELDQARMRGMIEMLYYRGYDGGILFIEVKGDDRFLQIRKQILAKGSISLRCDFPLVRWSEQYYNKIRAYLDAVGIEYADSAGVTDLAVHGPVPPRTLVISLGSDINVAAQFVDHVFREIFAVDPATRAAATVENVDPRDTRIGF